MKVKLITTCMLFFMSMIFSVEKLSAEETASALVDEVLAGGNKLVESYQPSSAVQTGNTWIGVFPTLESILLQTLLLSLMPLGYLWSKRAT